MSEITTAAMQSNALAITERGVDQFAQSLRDQVVGEHSMVQTATGEYNRILQAGGKRTRGVLTIYGFEMLGGKDEATATTAAGVIEALHAYLLVVDDVADRAQTRRGEPTAHVALQSHLELGEVRGDTKKIAEDLVISAALGAQHHAIGLVGELDVAADARLNALGNLSAHLARTCMGQVLDISSTTGKPLTEEDILRIATYKTAYYSFQMPLETGALLAGADKSSLGLLEKYSRHAGLAFQLQDDILGIYGDSTQMGKSTKSDITEGKQTLLVHYAHTAATTTQAAVLEAAIGNPRLTDEAFAACQEVIVETGALARVQTRAAEEVERASLALDAAPADWCPVRIESLRHMATFALKRVV